MGTPEFALPALDAVVNAGHQILAVYTAPPRPAGRGQKEMPSAVHQRALEYGLHVETPASLKDAQAQERFRSYNADAAVVAAYGLLLPKAILEAPRLGCINIHPSLLPRWRGAAPIQRTVMAGDRETGVVIMQMNAGLDTGDMLLNSHCEIKDGTTAGELHDTLARMSAPLLLRVLDGLAAGTIIPVKQPEEGAIYAQKITRDDCRIDWSKSASSIRQQILGLSPQPGAAFVHKGQPIKILKADIEPASPASAGTVLDGQLAIRCGEDSLRPLLVQRSGKKPMTAGDMLRGYPIAAGEILE
jgi:methionyl-tRNA formyltransferase